jgi:hypothetical protein
MGIALLIGGLCPHPKVKRLAVASFRILATRYDLLVLTRPDGLQPVFDAVQGASALPQPEGNAGPRGQWSQRLSNCATPEQPVGRCIRDSTLNRAPG